MKWKRNENVLQFVAIIQSTLVFRIYLQSSHPDSSRSSAFTSGCTLMNHWSARNSWRRQPLLAANGHEKSLQEGDPQSRRRNTGINFLVWFFLWKFQICKIHGFQYLQTHSRKLSIKYEVGFQNIRKIESINICLMSQMTKKPNTLSGRQLAN